MADSIGDRQPAPPWFASAVSEGALMVAISTALLWIGFEVLLHFVRHRIFWAASLAVSIAAVSEPTFYLTTAALYGAEHADVSTWHLLSIFAVFHQVYAIIISAMIAGGIALIVWIVRATARASAQIRAQAK